jgi:EmrB/QacA subfamily drug resistance transporter
MFRRLEYKWLVAIVFVIAMFMDILDTTIVNVALPKMGVQFGVTDSIEWVVTGYLLSLAIWIPGSGWLGDKFGTKKIFLLAFAFFIGASALCGAATSLNQLIWFRILQGVGGGMLTPVGTAMLYRAFPPAERAKASAVLTIPIVIAPALGPVLGGFLVDQASWRWIFYINVPIGIAGLIFGFIYLKEEKQDRAGSFDLAGFVLSGGGLASILYGLSRAAHHGWTDTLTLAALVGGIVTFALLVVVELKIKSPMLHLRLFKQRMFRNANIIGFLVFGGFIAGVFLLPFYVQGLRGQSALTSGFVQLPQAIGVILVGRIVALKYPKVGPKRFLISGVLGTSVATLGLLFVGMDSPLWLPAVLFFCRGVFMAQVFIPLNAATFSQITPRETGNASALYQTVRQVGGAFGVALAATILFSSMNSAAPPTSKAEAIALASQAIDGFHHAVLAAAAMSLIGLLGVFFIHDEDAAASMGKSGDAPAEH